MILHHRHPHPSTTGRRLGALVIAALAGMSTAAPATAAPPRSTASATPAASTAASCSAVTFAGASYCPTSIATLKAGPLPAGTKVVLLGVSVTQVSTTQVTVAALQYPPPCPPGNYCGASITVAHLVVNWSGTARPAAGSVIDLFGTAVTRSLKPVGFRSSTACYVDWC